MMRDRDRLPGRYSRCWIPVASRVTGFYGDGNARLPFARARGDWRVPGGDPQPPGLVLLDGTASGPSARRLDEGR